MMPYEFSMTLSIVAPKPQPHQMFQPYISSMWSYIAFYLSRYFITSDHLIEEPLDFALGRLLSKATNLSDLVAIDFIE